MFPTPQVKITLAPDAIMPEYAFPTDSGADLFSTESFTLCPGDTHAFSTGVRIELPEGYEAQVRSKSGPAIKSSVHVLNSPGTIDNSYRGDIKVILHNSSPLYQDIKKGQKIAQLVVTPYVQARFVLENELSTTERGEGGFGSTGLNVHVGTDDGRGPSFADAWRIE
jgi:dUTP pyrophosphatase